MGVEERMKRRKGWEEEGLEGGRDGEEEGIERRKGRGGGRDGREEVMGKGWGGNAETGDV